MLYGGGAMFSYTFFMDVITHHAETNLRPKFVDHAIALGIGGAAAGLLTGSGTLTRSLQGAMFFGLTVAPITWWLKLQGLRPGDYKKPTNILYQNDVTPEEVERFRHMD